MAIQDIGIVGWRGMVGSVLLERMRAEGDFKGLTTTFYSTSQVGGLGPDVGDSGGEMGARPLADAYDANALSRHDCIITCQGGDYTQQVLPTLRERGWQGYWIDAASAKRMDDDSIIVLDPVNRAVIDRGIETGIKNYVGGNCTVSLMLMGLGGLFAEDLIEWMTCMTYQAASGGGAKHMRELVAQMGMLGEKSRDLMGAGESGILELDRRISQLLRSDDRELRRPAGREPDPLDRSRHGDRRYSRRMEGLRRGQQDPRPQRSPDPDRLDLRPRRRDALPQPGLHDQAPQGRPARGPRSADRGPQRLGQARPQRQGVDARRALASGRLGDPRHPGRPGTEAASRARVSRGLHGRRSAALGRGGAAAPDAEHPAPGRRLDPTASS
jgi:hypothetical protein